MRLFRWSIPNLSMRDRVIVALCSMTLTFLALGVGWVKAKRYVRSKLLDTVQLIEKRTGWPLEIGSWYVGPGFVSLSEVRMGPEGNLLISEVRVIPGLNPFSRDFGKPASISIGSVRFKAQKDLLTQLSEKLGGDLEPQASHARRRGEDRSKEDPSAREERVKSRVAGFFQALPVETLEVKSAGFDIVDDDSQPLLAIRGLKLKATKENRKIIFRTESVAFKQYAPELSVEGRLGLSNSGQYRFFIRRRADARKSSPHWLLSGSADKTLDHVQIFLKTRALPAFLVDVFTPILGKDHRLVTSGRIKASREAGGWRFAVLVRSENTSFVSPMISKDPIGPVKFNLTARGEVSLEKKALTIESASIAIPPRKSGVHPSRPLEISLQGNGLLAIDRDLGLQVTMTADMPPTSCQTLLDTAPPGLIPKIEDFQLTGEASGQVKIVFDSKHPEVSEASPQNFTWNCQVEAEPELYAAQKLRAPFVIEKSDEVGEEAVTRVLSPSNPNFRTLREMSPSVPLAFVASEDASFFAHKGIDSSAIEGAFKRNMSEGRIAVGGSTITMQTAKNLFLTNDRTISRKLQELFFAWHLERILTKDRILEIYLNIVEFGPGIFGIAHASKHYFNKEPSALSLTEAAYLASLLPSPKNRYLSFCRGHLTPGLSHILSGLLKRMLNLGRISADRYEVASASGLRFNEQARLASAACTDMTQRERAPH